MVKKGKHTEQNTWQVCVKKREYKQVTAKCKRQKRTDNLLLKEKQNNVELNIAETGNNAQYNELATWFETLWTKPQAHKNKTLKDGKGKIYTKPFKEYLIGEIERIFIEYTPGELYYKVLFELFGEQLLIDQDNPEFNRQIGRLENSTVYQTLYKFQQKGVLSLIKMLQKYNGAILADAVGLGKTWSALAVMKFFQLQGREVILLCPKKLQNNWNPVRIIQRMGRIDRLGSPNSKIFGINFWPSNNINSYLDLQGRIEQRMAAMQLAGSEVHLDFSDTFKEMAEDENLFCSIGIWEKINNQGFNYPEFGVIEKEAGTNRFIMSVGQWIQRTNAV